MEKNPSYTAKHRKNLGISMAKLKIGTKRIAKDRRGYDKYNTHILNMGRTKN